MGFMAREQDAPAGTRTDLPDITQAQLAALGWIVEEGGSNTAAQLSFADFRDWMSSTITVVSDATELAAIDTSVRLTEIAHVDTDFGAYEAGDILLYDRANTQWTKIGTTNASSSGGVPFAFSEGTAAPDDADAVSGTNQIYFRTGGGLSLISVSWSPASADTWTTRTVIQFQFTSGTGAPNDTLTSLDRDEVYYRTNASLEIVSISFSNSGSTGWTTFSIPTGGGMGGTTVLNPYDPNHTYSSGELAWFVEGTSFSGVVVSRTNNNQGNTPLVRERTADWDILSGSDVSQIVEFYAAEERLPNADTAWRLESGTTAGLNGILEANPTSRWYDSIADIPADRRHLTTWRVLIHSKNYGQFVSVETPSPVVDPEEVAHTRAEVETSFPVNPFDVPDFGNYAGYAFTRAIDGSEHTNLVDLSFFDDADTELEADVLFRSNSLGRLDLDEIGARCSTLRASNNTTGRISVRVTGVYAQIEGTLTHTPTKMNVTGTGYLEVAHSQTHTHRAWTTLSPNEEPGARMVGSVTLTEATTTSTTTQGIIVVARLEPITGTVPSLVAGDPTNQPLVRAQDAMGIRFESTPYSTTFDDDVDVNTLFIMGYTQEATGGTNAKWQLFGNNVLYDTVNTAVQQAVTDFIVQGSRADLWYIFWTDTLSPAAEDNFSTRIIKEPFGDGFYGAVDRKVSARNTEPISIRAASRGAPYTGVDWIIRGDPAELIFDEPARSAYEYDTNTGVWTLNDLTARLTVGTQSLGFGIDIRNNENQEVTIDNYGARLIKNRGRAGEFTRVLVNQGSNFNIAANSTVGTSTALIMQGGTVSLSQGDTLELEPYAEATNRALDVEVTDFNVSTRHGGTQNGTPGGELVEFTYDGSMRQWVFTDEEGNEHPIFDDDGQPVGDNKAYIDGEIVIPTTFYLDSADPTLQYSASDFVWNATDDQFDIPAGLLREIPDTVTNDLFFVIVFRTQSEEPTAHAVLPTLPHGAGHGARGLHGLNAVSVSITGTFVGTPADATSEGDIHWINDNSIGNFTIYPSANHYFWRNLRVGTLVTGRYDANNYVQTRITSISTDTFTSTYEFAVIEVIGYLNGRSGTIHLDASQTLSTELVEYSNDNTQWVTTPPTDYRYIRTRNDITEVWNTIDLEQGSVVYIQYSDDQVTWVDTAPLEYSFVRIRGSEQDAWKVINISTVTGGNVGQEIASCTLAAGDHDFVDGDPILGWTLDANAPAGFSILMLGNQAIGVNLPHTKVADNHLGYWLRIFYGGAGTASIHDGTFDVGSPANSPIGSQVFPLSDVSLIMDPRTGNTDVFRVDSRATESVTLGFDLIFRLYLKNSAPGGAGHISTVATQINYFFTRSARTPDPTDAYVIMGTRGTDATLEPNTGNNWASSPEALPDTLSHLPLYVVIAESYNFVDADPSLSPAIPLPVGDNILRRHTEAQVGTFTSTMSMPGTQYLDGETDITYVDRNAIFALNDTSGAIVSLTAQQAMEGDLTIDFPPLPETGAETTARYRNDSTEDYNFAQSAPRIGEVYHNGNLIGTWGFNAGGTPTFAAGDTYDAPVLNIVVTRQITISGIQSGDTVELRFGMAGVPIGNLSFQWLRTPGNITFSGDTVLQESEEVEFGIDEDGDLFTQRGTTGYPTKLANRYGALGVLRGSISQRVKEGQTVRDITAIPNFENFVYWSFHRSASGAAGVPLCDLAFYEIAIDGHPTLIQDDVPYESDDNGRLDLASIGAQIFEYRTRETDPIDHDAHVSVRLKHRYAQVVGTLSTGTYNETDMITGALEVAFSTDIGHVSWAGLGDSGVPMMRTVGTTLVNERADDFGGANTLMAMHTKFFALNNETQAQIGDFNDFPRVVANENGISFVSDHINFNSHGTDVDFSRDQMLGFVIGDLDGTTDDPYTIFASNEYVERQEAAHHATSDLRIRLRNAYVGDIVYSNTLSTTMRDRFPESILKSRFDETGLFGRIYNDNLSSHVTNATSVRGPDRSFTYRPEMRFLVNTHWQNGITWHNLGPYFTAESNDRITWHGPPVEITIHDIASQDSEEPYFIAYNTSDTDATLTEATLNVRQFDNPTEAHTYESVIASMEPDSQDVPSHTFEDIDVTIGTREPSSFIMMDGHQMEFVLTQTPGQTGTLYLSGGNVQVTATATVLADGVAVDIEQDGGTSYLTVEDELKPTADERTRLIDLTAPQILIPTEAPRLFFYVNGQNSRTVLYHSSALNLTIGTDDKVKIPFNLTADELLFGATNDIVTHVPAADVYAYTDPPLRTGNDSGVLEFQAGEYDLQAELTIRIANNDAQNALVTLRRSRLDDIAVGDHTYRACCYSPTNDYIYAQRYDSPPPPITVDIRRYNAATGAYVDTFGNDIGNHNQTAIACTEDRMWTLGDELGGNIGQIWARAWSLDGTRMGAEDSNLTTRVEHPPIGAEYYNGNIYVLTGDNAGEANVDIFTDDFSIRHERHSLPVDTDNPYDGITVIDGLIYVRRGSHIHVFNDRGTHLSDNDFQIHAATYRGLTFSPHASNTLYALEQVGGDSKFQAWDINKHERILGDEKLDEFFYVHPSGTNHPFIRTSLEIPSITFENTEQVYFESDGHGSDIRVFGYLVVKQLKKG